MSDMYNLMEIRKLYGLSQTEFARLVKMSRELVSKIENGKSSLNKPTVQKIRRFIENNSLHNFSQDVNILGKASQDRQAVSGMPYREQRLESKNAKQPLLVPLVGIKAQAGYVKGYEQADYMDTLEKYSLPPGVNPTGAAWSYFEVDGDSMEPTLYAGDVILASMVTHEDWHDVKNFYLYLILTPEQLLVKRIYKKSNTEWVLISDNEDYQQTTIAIEQVKQLWVFRRHIRARAPMPREVKIESGLLSPGGKTSPFLSGGGVQVG